ncbi:MAG: hypothetical protein IPF87_14860 [Gemmatimonadetes bacterium]|nr:hypothetical protein [Gemmatimonadota bacterium]
MSTTGWTERRRVVALSLWYVLVLALVAAFLVRDSFSVPSFIYQEF